MIYPETLKYDGQIASSICCDQIGAPVTVPLEAGQVFCVGQPVSLNISGEGIVGISNYAGIAIATTPGVDVTYATAGSQACVGSPVYADGVKVYTGIEPDPLGNFSLADGGQGTGNVPPGEKDYVVTFLQTNCKGTFESGPSPLNRVTIPTALGHSVQVTNIPTGVHADTTGRNIYRKSEDIYTPYVPVTATSSSFTASPPGYPPTNTIDNNYSTYWLNDISQPISTNDSWVKIDLGSISPVDQISHAFYFNSFASNNYDVEYSTDDVAWNTIELGVSTGFTDGTKFFNFATTNMRYIRFTYKAGSGFDNDYLAVADISAYQLVQSQYMLVDTIADNTTTIYTDIKDDPSLINQQPPASSQLEYSLTDVASGNFEIGRYDLGTGCINIPLALDGCIANNCAKKAQDMLDGEYAVVVNENTWQMWDITIDNPAIPKQLRHYDIFGTSRKVRRLIEFEGTIVSNSYSGKWNGINAVQGVWKTAANPTLQNDGFFRLEWVGKDNRNYFTFAQVYGSKPQIEVDGRSNVFSTKFTVQLVSEGPIFVGDEQVVIVEEGHIGGLDIGEGGVSYSQSGLSDLENPTQVDLSSNCNKDSQIPIAVRIRWTGNQDNAELPPNTGDEALGNIIANYIIFGNATTGTAIKMNVEFKRTDTIDIDKDGNVYYNGVENPSIVDSQVFTPPTLTSGTQNELILSDDSYWGENAHGKLIEAEISFFEVT